MDDSAALGPEALVGVFQALTSQDASAIAREMQAFVDHAKAIGMAIPAVLEFLSAHGVNGGDDFAKWIETAYISGHQFKR